MLQKYINWAKKNGGITEEQAEDFETLAHSLGYDDPYAIQDFAADLIHNQTPPAEIIDLMRKGLTTRQLEAEIQN